MDALFSEGEEYRRKAQEFIESNSRISGKTKGWLYMLTEPVATRVVEKVQQAALARFEAARSIYEGYQNVKEKTGMSLQAYCFSLYTFADNLSWNFFKNWYVVYRHFMIYSKMNPEELLGINFRLLRGIAEGGSIFTPADSQRLIIDLKKLITRPRDQWAHFKNFRNAIKAANEKAKASHAQGEDR